jgi:hypothetical protein
MRNVLIAIRQPVSPPVESDLRTASQHLDIAVQNLRSMVQRQAILQNDLTERNRQLRGRFLIRSARKRLSSVRDGLRENLRLNGMQMQHAIDACNQAEGNCHAELTQLRHRRKQRNLKILQMLNPHMKRYLEAVQIRPSTSAMQQINVQLAHANNKDKE